MIRQALAEAEVIVEVTLRLHGESDLSIHVAESKRSCLFALQHCTNVKECIIWCLISILKGQGLYYTDAADEARLAIFSYNRNSVGIKYGLLSRAV